MAVSLTIPLTTLPPGTRTVGPVSVPSSLSSATIVIDRTAGTSSLNNAPNTVNLNVTVEVRLTHTSPWRVIAEVDTPGGTYIDRRTGTTITTTSILCGLDDGQGTTTRDIQATLVVTGGTITIAGHLDAS